ncbi:MAG: hypothetical protein IPN51_02570 [Chloracidobacterium sp.]|nr:hypothetical protein [Chloracidobacterium sp.]
MLLFISNIILFFSGAAAAGSGGAWESFKHFYNEWFNFPGFEIWKFINLFLFIAIGVYLLKKPLGDAFKAKREAIRSQLIKAEEEKQAALAKLTAAEAKLAQLETEKQGVFANAKAEAEAEKQRLAAHTETEIQRLRQQTEAEIARLVSQSRAELRRFAAEESIRLAEQKLRSQINGESDARLVRANIQEIGGLN